MLQWNTSIVSSSFACSCERPLGASGLSCCHRRPCGHCLYAICLLPCPNAVLLCLTTSSDCVFPRSCQLVRGKLLLRRASWKPSPKLCPVTSLLADAVGMWQATMSEGGATIIDASSISFVDSAGLKLLSHTLTEASQHHVTLLADPSQAMLRMLHRGNLLDRLGKLLCFSDWRPHLCLTRRNWGGKL